MSVLVRDVACRGCPAEPRELRELPARAQADGRRRRSQRRDVHEHVPHQRRRIGLREVAVCASEGAEVTPDIPALITALAENDEEAAFRVVPSLHEALAPVAREHPALLKRYQANVPPQVFDRLLHMARDRGSAAPLELLHLLSYRHAALATHVVTHDLPPLVALLEPRATRGSDMVASAAHVASSVVTYAEEEAVVDAALRTGLASRVVMLLHGNEALLLAPGRSVSCGSATLLQRLLAILRNVALSATPQQRADLRACGVGAALRRWLGRCTDPGDKVNAALGLAAVEEADEGADGASEGGAARTDGGGAGASHGKHGRRGSGSRGEGAGERDWARQTVLDLVALDEWDLDGTGGGDMRWEQDGGIAVEGTAASTSALAGKGAGAVEERAPQRGARWRGPEKSEAVTVTD